MSKIKEKVAAKVAKGKEKVNAAKERVAKKCGRARPCFLIALALVAVSFADGCQNPAQRSQTLSFDDCAFTFNVNTQTPTNAVCATPSFEIGTQAQSNETAGNDAGLVASPTNDIKPDVDVPVSLTGGGTTEATSEAVTAAATAAKALLSSCSSSSSSCSDGSCTDGSCSDSSCSTCTDGSCSD